MKEQYHVETKKECTTTLIMQHYIQHQWDELNSQYIHKGVYQNELFQNMKPFDTKATFPSNTSLEETCVL